MRSFLLWTFAFLTTAVSPVRGENSSGITWVTNYQEAVAQSRATSKPMVLFFTGSDWCGWCHKIEDEILNMPDFNAGAGDKFIFVKLDFPMYKPLAPDLSCQNKELQRKFDVRSFPTLIILDDMQEQIGSTGYRPGGGRAYAEHLIKTVQDYNGFRQKTALLDRGSLTGKELRQLYEKARALSKSDECHKIVKIGMKSNEKPFFLMERYRYLADEKMIGEAEAIALKQQLLATDPLNQHLTHFQVAVIDFEAASDELAPDLAVAPLVAYIHTFGDKDPENIWRLQMIISQVYLDKNRYPEALDYARSSLRAAPASVQPEIATTIKNIQSQLR